ncbi:beta-propeller fold lactonase family protein [uncultured Microbacterium sp.]|uniref:lactonase family protein n=1 Tax=uncultured Microbacterium sp. TaxID=191216 RepID=UPI00261F0F83|nr:beta-propeller fold lactonase family protein [uncultured Microbacterium sp.]
MRYLLGGYTSEMGGDASGIGVLVTGEGDAGLTSEALGLAPDAVAVEGSPSWVTRGANGVFYAGLEGTGGVQAFAAAGGGRLRRLGDPVAAGELPCHVAVSPDARFVLATCWGDGRVVRFAVRRDGSLGEGVAARSAGDPYGAVVHASGFGSDEGDGAEGGSGADAGAVPAGDGERRGEAGAPRRGPDPAELSAAAAALRAAVGPEFAGLVPDYSEAEAAANDEASGVESDADSDSAEPARVSRAHQSRFLPGGLIATTDMGFDLLRFWRDGADGLRPAGEIVFPRGSGPRHTAWHPSGHLYVVTELSREVFVLAPDAAGAWRIVSATPLAGTLDTDTAAEIALDRTGEHVYVGVRGSNTIATLNVTDAGSGIRFTALVDAGVDWPRHHLVETATLLVAGQRSNEIASLPLDPRTGVPGRVRYRTTAPSPTCIARLR